MWSPVCCLRQLLEFESQSLVFRRFDVNSADICPLVVVLVNQLFNFQILLC